MSAGTRENGRSYAAVNFPARLLKARKIERLLGSIGRSLRILEVGTGSGVVAHYFSTQGHQVQAVDVVDERAVTDGYSFEMIQGVQLPFPDNSFDIVISNHVIEHVGELQEQTVHIQEIRRVLALGGTGYLAMPNRWMLVEPHYRLPFLSWLPVRWADSYVKLLGRSRYDCRPLSRRGIETEFRKAGLSYIQHHQSALEVMREIEFSESRLALVLIRIMPSWFFVATASLFPTLIYTIGKK